MNPQQRVAVVGIGGIFAQSLTPEQFWTNISSGRDASREVPRGRWLLPPETIFDPTAGTPDRVYSTRGYFIEGFQLDPTGLAALDVDTLDPVFHLTLHAGRAAWQDAVTAPLDRDRVGVILGSIVLPIDKASEIAAEILGTHPTGRPVDARNCHPTGLPAVLLADALGLRGGAYTIDAACASSLYAIKLAMDDLTSGRKDAMLAGGVSRPDCLYTQMGFSQLRALAPSGRCAPFDASGDGLLVGEGAGVFVLKRLADAVAHGDSIYGVLRAVGLSNDREGNLLAPATEGQLRALRAAYAGAEWDPADVDLIECHATGTPIGDVVELQSLHELWREKRFTPGQCVLGAVKSNVGHTLTAAGAAALMKVLLAMRHETLPPTANFRRPRPDLSFDGSPFRVLMEAEPWRRRSGRPRRAAVSGFGFGGINAHLLVEEFVRTQTSVSLTVQPRDTDPKPVAVVGMAAHVGSCEDLVAFAECAFEHRQMPNSRIESVTVGMKEFRIPPRDLEESLPQQILMLRTAAAALAQVGSDAQRNLRCGVFIGLGLDLNTTNFHLRWSCMSARESDQADESISPLSPGRTLGALASITASRIARAFGLGGPSFTLSDGENSGLIALQVACELLRRREIDQAVVGAVDLTGDVRMVRACAIDKPADGAVSLVLKRLDDAERHGDEILAMVREIGSEPSVENVPWVEHLGSSEPLSPFGYLGAVTSLAAAARAVLALRHKILFNHNCPRKAAVSSRTGNQPFLRVIFEQAPSTAEFGSPLLRQLQAMQTATARAHSKYLQFSDRLMDTLSRGVSLVERKEPQIVLTREQCLEFAAGSIGAVFGPLFEEVDHFPTRVRLPEEPLMLVDRVLKIGGEPCSMGRGNVVTEHDILADAWYLDNRRVPASIAIESGQADLLLSAYLGIDFRTRGLAMYRLLDATVTFHGPLPGAGVVIQHDIHIDEFFRQGDTYLFRFRFESSIDGQPLLTMHDGCAGFFNDADLASGKGLVQKQIDAGRKAPAAPETWRPLFPVAAAVYDENQIESLARGDLAGCFGPTFARLALQAPLTIPSGQIKVLHRVSLLDPGGGAYSNGIIRSDQVVDPAAWYLTCHFIDDQVMPGTLMYECCLHSLRIFLLRLGWTGEADQVHMEPVPSVPARLKCRGQVIVTTRQATYEIHIKTLGYRPEPYALADAYVYADGKAIVEIVDLSLQLTGSKRETLEALWKMPPVAVALFERRHILAFASGKPSEAFGEPYRVFDEKRRMARLPRPPYSFLDRITVDAKPWEMQAGGSVSSQYDVPEDAWYFASNRQPFVPFAVLLEMALQTCGWMAAYMGSALLSSIDLRFRNLGGTAEQVRSVTEGAGTFTTCVRVKQVSHWGGSIIQHYDFAVSDAAGEVYRGDTYFGFFSDEALAQQVGIREVALYKPGRDELQRGRRFAYPVNAPFPDHHFRMVDQIDLYIPDGGAGGLGFIEGGIDVDPNAWFFEAHFYQDPVWPGSLGLEAFWQLLKVIALDKFGGGPESRFMTASPRTTHRWIYRGQVIPSNVRVTLQASLTAVDPQTRTLTADGWLTVDGLLIYQMQNFSITLG